MQAAYYNPAENPPQSIGRWHRAAPPDILGTKPSNRDKTSQDGNQEVQDVVPGQSAAMTLQLQRQN